MGGLSTEWRELDRSVSDVLRRKNYARHRTQNQRNTSSEKILNFVIFVGFVVVDFLVAVTGFCRWQSRAHRIWGIKSRSRSEDWPNGLRLLSLGRSAAQA